MLTNELIKYVDEPGFVITRPSLMNFEINQIVGFKERVGKIEAISGRMVHVHFMDNNEWQNILYYELKLIKDVERVASRKQKPWSELDIQMVRDYKHLPDEDLSIMIGRSVYAIQQCRHVNEIKKKR